MCRSDYQRLVCVAVLIWSVFFQSSMALAARPAIAYNGKMNSAVGGVVTHKVSKWGFAANDPRFGATLNGVGAGVTTIAVGVAGGAVAAVGWPALLAGAAIAAVVTGAITLAQDGLYKWLFSPDGTVTTTTPGAGPSTWPTGPMTWWAHIEYWDGYNGGAGRFYNKAFPSTKALCDRNWAVTKHPSGAVQMPSTKPGRCVYDLGPAYGGVNWFDASPNDPDPNYVDTSAPIDEANLSPMRAADNVPDSELGKPLSNTMLAAAANAAWRSMPAGTPNAVPWSATDPITPSDVAEWKALNPSAVPTVGDFLAPSSAGSPSAGGGVTVSPEAVPGTNPAPGPAPTPGQGEKVDLGPNPNTPAPSLEATPTALQILSPLLGLMPDLKKFTVPAHASECPKPSFTALGKVYAIDSHCPLVESNRSIIETAMLLCWTIASVFIVLRA